MNNKKQLRIGSLIILLLHNFVECIEINNMIKHFPFFSVQTDFVIERKPKVLWLLIIGTLCIPLSFLIIHKNRNVNQIKKANYRTGEDILNQNISKIKKDNGIVANDTLLNKDVSIVDYNINEHEKAVEEIVRQGPDSLDDTAGSSTNQKILDIMNDLRNKNITKILINRDACPIGFINFCVKYSGTGYILLLAIDENNKKKGYGTLLIQHAMNELRKQNVTRITIDVLSDNKPAKQLYEKLKFAFDEENPIRRGVIQGIHRFC